MDKVKNGVILLFLIILMFLLYLFVASKLSDEVEISYSVFFRELQNKNIKKLVFIERKVEGEFKHVYISENGKEYIKFHSRIPFEDAELQSQVIEKYGVEEVVAKEEKSSLLFAIVSAVPYILLIVLFIYFFKGIQSSGNKAMSFGKSRAKLATPKNKTTFADVAGADEAEEELGEIIEFLREPKKFTKLGGKIPKGCLIIGPPGTGKTLLAKAVAGEANVPFLSISGSEFVEMFVGVGASRVRDLFDKGKKNAPCIIFIDEIDAVGRHRGAGLGGGHDEREQTLNQLLVEMDGFEPNEGVIIMAATNRPDVLDPALLRPGRFDRRIVVSRPDLNGREGILKIHTREVILEEGVDLALIARGTPGLSGADLANLVNEAALLAARRGKNTVSMQEFEDAKDKVLMGIERKSLIISPEEKRIIAYHESGHALLAQLLEYTDPVHKVTIIPRGMALGVTQQLPVSDKYNYSKKYLLDEICVLLGGRASEEIFLDMKTTGSENDLEKVTNLARHMVCNWGMSDKVGPLTLGKKEGEIFLGKEISTTSHLSEDTTKLIDSEIKAIVMSQMELAKEILLKNKSILEEVVKYLLTYEVLTGEDIKDIIQGKDLAKIKLLQKNKAKAKEARKKRKARKKKVIAEMELSRDAKSDEDNSVLDFVKQVKDEDSGQDKEIKTDLKSPDE